MTVYDVVIDTRLVRRYRIVADGDSTDEVLLRAMNAHRNLLHSSDHSRPVDYWDDMEAEVTKVRYVLRENVEVPFSSDLAEVLA
jgi:hypothetical protein